MKLIFTFTLFCFVFLTVNAIDNPIATITFSNPQKGVGISFVINTSTSAEAYTESANKGQLDCRFIPSGKYGYFKVDNALILPTDSKLIFDITYFDSGNDNFTLHYNSLTTNYKSFTISKTNSNTWVTVRAGLTDAALANLQNNQADFRFSGEVYIRQVSITKGELDPTKESVPVTSGSSYSEFKGKSVAGYQAWFTASDTNSGWVHWSGNTKPAIGNQTFLRPWPSVAILRNEGR